MNQHIDEGDLERLNRLLERLHQAGYAQHGSHIEIVGVSPGAQHVNHQYIASPLTPLQGARGTLRGRGVVSSEGGEVKERIRRCISQLMTERYGEEPLFCLQGHWQAVYRILVDKGYCRDSDFDGFDAFIRRVMPEEVNKPYKKDSVKQISKTDFALPFERWHYDPQTSTTRKPYDRMVAIATRFKEILEGNGL